MFLEASVSSGLYPFFLSSSCQPTNLPTFISHRPYVKTPSFCLLPLPLYMLSSSPTIVQPMAAEAVVVSLSGYEQVFLNRFFYNPYNLKKKAIRMKVYFLLCKTYTVDCVITVIRAVISLLWVAGCFFFVFFSFACNLYPPKTKWAHVMRKKWTR